MPTGGKTHRRSCDIARGYNPTGILCGVLGAATFGYELFGIVGPGFHRQPPHPGCPPAPEPTIWENTVGPRRVIMLIPASPARVSRTCWDAAGRGKRVIPRSLLRTYTLGWVVTTVEKSRMLNETGTTAYCGKLNWQSTLLVKRPPVRPRLCRNRESAQYCSFRLEVFCFGGRGFVRACRPHLSVSADLCAVLLLLCFDGRGAPAAGRRYVYHVLQAVRCQVRRVTCEYVHEGEFITPGLEETERGFGEEALPIGPTWFS